MAYCLEGLFRVEQTGPLLLLWEFIIPGRRVPDTQYEQQKVDKCVYLVRFKLKYDTSTLYLYDLVP